MFAQGNPFIDLRALIDSIKGFKKLSVVCILRDLLELAFSIDALEGSIAVLEFSKVCRIVDLKKYSLFSGL